MEAFDLIVIGAGSAGFAAMIHASELGAKVALIEGGTIGGTCVNVGCVPSKTLIRAAETNQHARESLFRGIFTRAEPPNWNDVRGHKDELVSVLRKERYIDVLKAYAGVQYFESSGRLIGANQVVLANGKKLLGNKILIATGARPSIPPIPGLTEIEYLNSTSVMELEILPKSMIVIGASAVGLELAQMFSRLGVEITVVEIVPRIVPGEDPEISEALQKYLEEEGVKFITGAKIVRVLKGANDQEVCLEYTDQWQQGQCIQLRAEQLLVATGRTPNTANLGLETTRVKLDQKGFIQTNEFMQTDDPRIYAAGDCTSPAMFVYVAAYSGNLAAENALNGSDRKFDISVLPRVTFTDPQVASVGFTEDQAKAKGLNAVSAKLPLDYVPRALAARNTRGFIKLVADTDTNKLIGAHLLASEAGEAIQVAVFAIKYGISIDELAASLFPYLTLNEGIKLCAQMFKKDVSKLSCCAA